MLNANVRLISFLKFKKGQFLLPFFFVYTKIISIEGMMMVLGFLLFFKIQNNFTFFIIIWHIQFIWKNINIAYFDRIFTKS